MNKTTDKSSDLRLNKLISSTGLVSRRGADELIKNGEVVINGKVIIDPATKVIWGKDSIKVSGKLITKKEPLVYYFFNKPSKVISTLYDPEQRPCIKDYIKQIKSRVIPVDMLSYDSSGAILLTNDGDLINSLTNSSNITKTYKLKIAGLFSPDTMEKVLKRIKSTDKHPKKTKLRYLKRVEKNFWVELTLTTLPNKEIEFNFNKYGWDILKTIRLKYFDMSLKGIAPGEFRQLSKHEISTLKSV